MKKEFLVLFAECIIGSHICFLFVLFVFVFLLVLFVFLS